MAEDMEFLPRQQILSLEEIVQISSAFVALGVSKIRLTGGEPLIRKGVVGLAQQLSRLDGLDELVMTTNATRLKSEAASLARAGIKRLNISLDSLQPERFQRLTRCGDLPQVLQGIEAARLAGFERLKINAVILRGENEDEVINLAKFALDRGMDISFIEEMPLGEIDSHQRSQSQYQSQSIRERLAADFNLLPTTESTGGPSRYYSANGNENRIGFISPISDNFCASCNRVRLTAEGRLLLCLGNEHSLNLKDFVRRYPGDMNALKERITEAIAFKPERHYFDPQSTQILRFMNATGG